MFVAFAFMPKQRTVLAGREITATAAEFSLCLSFFFLLLVYNNSLNFTFPKQKKLFMKEMVQAKMCTPKVLFMQSYDI